MRWREYGSKLFGSTLFIQRTATYNMSRAACNIPRATCNVPRATCHVQRAASHVQHAACNMPRAACHVQHPTCNVQHPTCSMPRAVLPGRDDAFVPGGALPDDPAASAHRGKLRVVECSEYAQGTLWSFSASVKLRELSQTIPPVCPHGIAWRSTARLGAARLGSAATVQRMQHAHRNTTCENLVVAAAVYRSMPN